MEDAPQAQGLSPLDAPTVLTVDFEAGEVTLDNDKAYALDSPEAFSAISAAWLRCGWDTKYVYSFTWLGRPIIQLPDDLIRLQEVIYRVQPDVIVETGVAHGGSLVFCAALCKVMEKGKVIGVDVEVRPHNRSAIEEHPLSPLITLVEADSAAASTIDRVASLIEPHDTVLILLDSNHTKEHVLRELEGYSHLVTLGSYIVAMDGIMERVAGAPRTSPDWSWNNPRQAVAEFVESRPEFEVEDILPVFNEGSVTERVTYWPDAFVKRVRASSRIA